MFRLLSLVSHTVEGHNDNTDESPSCMCIDNPEIVVQRRGFVKLCVDLLLAISFPPENAVPVPAVEEGGVEPPTTATSTSVSRAYSILVSSVGAIGAIVNTVSSSTLWNHVFGKRHDNSDSNGGDIFEKLLESDGPVRGFVWRILTLLSDLECCCRSHCWGEFSYLLVDHSSR